MENWWDKYETVESSDSPAAAPATKPTEGAANENWWDKYETVEVTQTLDGNALSRGLSRGADMAGQFYGSALESVGSALNIAPLEEAGRARAVRNRAELRSSTPSMTTEDIDGVGSLGSFTAEKLGETALPMGVTIGAGFAAGAAATAWSGPGALVGGLIGAGAATLANLPYMFGSFRERQKDEDIAANRPIEVDDGAAAAYALPASALDAVTDLFLVGKLGKFMKPALESKSLLTRVTTNAATGATVESLTEVGQTVLERHQAGLSLTDEEAQNEYFEAAVAGGLIGGGVKGTLSVRAPKTEVENTGGGTDAAQRSALRGNTTSTTPGSVDPDQAAALGASTDIGAPNPEGEKARELLRRLAAQRAAAGSQVTTVETAEEMAAKPTVRTTPPPAPASDLTPEQRAAAGQQAAAELNSTARPGDTSEVTASPAPAADPIVTPPPSADASATTPPPAADTPAPTSPTTVAAQGIERGMKAMAEGARRAGRERVADMISKGAPVTYRNPEAIAAAKEDPLQVVVDNPDGSVTVTGIKVDENSEWVGTAPEGDLPPVIEGTELDETLLSDTALNEDVPAPAETLSMQFKEMSDPKGKRAAVYIPPEAMGDVNPDDLPRGGNIYAEDLPNGGLLYWSYNKSKLGPKAVRSLYKKGNLGRILGVDLTSQSETAAAPDVTPEGNPEPVAPAAKKPATKKPAAPKAPKAEKAPKAPKAPKAEAAKRTSKARAQPAEEPKAPVKGKADFTPEEIAEIERKANAKPARGVFWDKTQMKSMIEVEGKDGKLEVREATPAEVSETTKKFNDKVAERAAEMAVTDENKPLAIADKTGLPERRAAADRGEFKSAKEEMAARIPDDSKEGERTIKERVRQAELGDSIREKFGPKETENLGQIDEIEARFKETLEAADRAGIKIPNEVSAITPNSLAWLKQMKLMQGKIAVLRKPGTRKPTRESILAQLVDYLGAELDYMETGSTEGFRATRKAVAESIATSRNASSNLDSDEDMMAQVADENAVDIEEQLDAQREGDNETDGTQTEEEDEAPEFQAGDNVVVIMGEESEVGTIVSGPKMRGDRPFYRVRFADGASDEFAADGFNMFKLPKRAEITSEGDVQPYGETDEAATLGELDRNGREEEFALETVTLNELQDRLTSAEALGGVTRNLRNFTVKQLGIQNKLAKMLFKRLTDVVGGVKVHVLDDVDFDKFAPRADAYYNKDGDYIAIRKSAMDDNVSALHTVIHEAAHAAFEHAIKQSRAFRKQLEGLLELAKAHAELNNYGTERRGFQNIHEFLSEAWGNPNFQEFLGSVPIKLESRAKLGITGPSVLSVKNAFAMLKNMLSQVIGIKQLLADQGFSGSKSLLEAAMDVSGNILELSPEARKRFYDGTVNIVNTGVRPQGRISTATEAFKRWFRKSKVVTPEGNPLVVYHGGNFNENEDGVFRPGRSFGYFFTPNKKKAQSYAPGYGENVPVTSAYLSLQNPFDPRNDEHVFAPWVKDWIDFWRQEEGWVDRQTGEEMDDSDVYRMIEDVRLYEYEENGLNISQRWDDFLRTAQDHHDGFYGYDPTDGAVIAVAFDPTQIKSVNNRGTFDPSNPDILANDRADNSVFGRLTQRGMDEAQARNVAAMIDEELGGTVTDEELATIVGALGKPVGSQQGLNGPSPYIPPKLPGRVAKLFGAGPLKSGPLAKALLYVMTLDFIDTKFRSLFGDKAGNALSDYVNAAFSYQKIAQDVAALHDLDMADYYDLFRNDPQKRAREIAKMQKVVGILEYTDIDISDGATNDHLKQGNKRKHLQSKKALPEVQALLRSMEPETLELLRRMAANYKKSHDDYMQAVTYTILEGLETKLSNSDMMRIIDHVVNGKLDAQDKLDVNNDEVFAMLERSEMLKKRKGSYFPAERIGEYVVTTEVRVDDPKITSVVTKSGRNTVPIKTEIDGGTVRFTFDYGIRGSRGAVTKAVYDWVASHELPMQSYVVKYRDRQSGEIVGAGDMDATRDYDMVHEVKLQNRGVHMFENVGDARSFMEQAAKDKASGKLLDHTDVLPKHAEQVRNYIVPPGALDAVFKSIDKSTKITDSYRREQMKNALREAVTRNMAGNRYEKRLMGRQNILGASDDVGRAAANYGRSVGNAIARIRSGGARAEAMQRIREIEKARRTERNVGGLVGEVMNELLRREALTDGPLANNQILDNLSTLNSVDKLLSPANWFLNLTQVPLNSLPFLGGRFGVMRSARAIQSTYKLIGAGGALKSGLKNTGKAITQAGKNRIDLNDVLGSIRKNAGIKYKDLFETLIETGDITENVGIENAQQLAGGRGKFGTALVKMDRAMRAMPNAIEAVNRSVVAIAAFDLATKSGMSKAEAIAYAREALRRTQFRYDEANKSMLMRKNPALRFFFTFKQFGQGQYQMLADALGRAFNDASPAERAMARKQLYTLLAVQAMTAGVFSIPAIELVKVGFMLGAALGLGDGWDDDMDKLREVMKESMGQDVTDIVSKGVLSKVMGVDLSSRISWADLIVGYPPRSGEKQDLMAWLGQAMAGPQGSMVYEMLIGGPRAMIEGDYAKGLSLMLPIKAVSDTVKTVGGVADGKMDPLDAAKQVLGFKSLRQGNISDETGARIRSNQRKKKEESDLIADYLNAVTRGDVARAAAAIRDYNNTLPEDGRKIRIGDRNSGLEMRRRENVRQYAE